MVFGMSKSFSLTLFWEKDFDMFDIENCRSKFTPTFWHYKYNAFLCQNPFLIQVGLRKGFWHKWIDKNQVQNVADIFDSKNVSYFHVKILFSTDLNLAPWAPDGEPGGGCGLELWGHGLEMGELEGRDWPELMPEPLPNHQANQPKDKIARAYARARVKLASP